MMDSRAINEAARLLIEARRTGNLLAALPPACRPETIDDAHAIQAATIAGLGETVAGWKIGWPVKERVVRGAILQSRVFRSGQSVPASLVPLLCVEVEVAFRFDRDLPPRDPPYTYAEVAEAVTALVGIEIVDSRYKSYRDAPLIERIADCVSNGGFVMGTLQPRWREFDLATLNASLVIDGKVIVRSIGGHVAVDPLLPAVALVNDLQESGGVRAGQVMTTGTYTGLNYAKPGQTVSGIFEGFGSAEVRFAP
jgi:2-keto-4-pentenoate hydratase